MPRQSKIRISQLQSILFTVLIGLGVVFLAITVGSKIVNAVLLFFVVTVSGLWMCNSTCIKSGDPKLNSLSLFWLVKIIITFCLIYFGWIPQLDPSSSNWGYDAQRFYYDAWELVENDWNPTANLNYQGVLYYYGVIFYLFGHNPVNPALVNSWLTLYATLYLIDWIYENINGRKVGDFRIAWLVLIPEILWYDAITSRETFVANLVVVLSLNLVKWLNSSIGVRDLGFLIVNILGFFAIAAMRASVVIPMIIIMVVITILVRSKGSSHNYRKTLFCIIPLMFFLVTPAIQKKIGGYDVDFRKDLENLSQFESNIASQSEWAQNSIGFLITPNNFYEAIIFLPVRMILYLAAPLPNIGFTISELISGQWAAWQSLLVVPSSILMLISFPYVLAGISPSWKKRNLNPAPLILHSIFWISFISVAGGNIIIHERYRIMMTMVFFACVWLGFTRVSKSIVRRWSFVWYGFLTLSFMAYYFYKQI
jgi:hypothetical protein